MCVTEDNEGITAEEDAPPPETCQIPPVSGFAPDNEGIEEDDEEDEEEDNEGIFALECVTAPSITAV